MKLGVVTYCKKGEMPYKKGIATHLPSKLAGFYIEHFHPYDIYETELLGVKGYEVCLRFTEEEMKQKGTSGKRLLEKVKNNACKIRKQSTNQYTGIS